MSNLGILVLILHNLYFDKLSHSNLPYAHFSSSSTRLHSISHHPDDEFSEILTLHNEPSHITKYARQLSTFAYINLSEWTARSWKGELLKIQAHSKCYQDTNHMSALGIDFLSAHRHRHTHKHTLLHTQMQSHKFLCPFIRNNYNSPVNNLELIHKYNHVVVYCQRS